MYYNQSANIIEADDIQSVEEAHITEQDGVVRLEMAFILKRNKGATPEFFHVTNGVEHRLLPTRGSSKSITGETWVNVTPTDFEKSDREPVNEAAHPLASTLSLVSRQGGTPVLGTIASVSGITQGGSITIPATE